MAGIAGIANQVARECIAKFPKAATKTLATKLYVKSPELWPNLEACRLMIRRLRGQQGALHRKTTRTVPDEREYDAKKQFKLPEGLREIDDFEPFRITEEGRWLQISDLHMPWHVLKALMCCIEEAKRRKIVGILLNGDIADCFALSRWEKDPRNRDFPAELRMVRELLAFLRKTFPKARIVWKAGNHEARFAAYMMVKAPELLDVDDCKWESLTRCADHGVEWIGDCRPVTLGKLYVLHGHEYRFAIANPVNPARGLFLKAQVSAMCGHFHQSAQHSEKNLGEHVTSCWSNGCLCDLHPEYMPLNKWNHGAAIVEVFKGGAFSVDNFRIVDGTLWH